MHLIVQVITYSQLSSFKDKTVIKVIGSFGNEVDALKFTAINQPAIIFLDYKIEQANTELFIKSLLIESPDNKVILLGNQLSDEIILSCLVSAIYGYLEWRDVDKFLHKAIRSVGKGEAWVSRRLVGLLIGKLRG